MWNTIDLKKIFLYAFILHISTIIIFYQNYITIWRVLDILMIGLFVCYIIYKNKNFRLNPLIKLYALFVLFSFASSLWSIDFEVTSFKSMQMLLIIINLTVIYYFMAVFNLKKAFLLGVLLGSFVNYLIVFELVSVPFDIAMDGRYFGTTGNPNALATLMLMSMFLSMLHLIEASNKKNFFYYYQYVNILLAVFTILLTVSKKGIIFGSILLLYYIVLSLKSKEGFKRLVFLMSAGAVAAFFLIDWNQVYDYIEDVIYRFDAMSSGLGTATDTKNSTEIRKNLILLGLRIFQDQPIMGYGLDTFRFLSGGQYAHNNFIELLVGVGFFGFFLFYSMYVYLLFFFSRMPKSSIKNLLVMFVLILLSMDVALVSYGDKLTIYMLLFLSLYVNNIKIKTI